MSAYTGVYGNDSAVVPDLDWTFTALQDDAQIVLNDAYKLLTTAQGYIWWAPEVPTMDLGDWALDSTSQGDLDECKVQVEDVLLHDPRVAEAVATPTHDPIRDVLTVDVVFRLVTGATFRAVFSVDNATVTVERVT